MENVYVPAYHRRGVSYEVFQRAEEDELLLPVPGELSKAEIFHQA